MKKNGLKRLVSSVSVIVFFAFAGITRAALIWDNGQPDPGRASRNISSLYDADDFVLATPEVITSLEIYVTDGTKTLRNFDGTLGYAFYTNNNGIPGTLIQSGYDDHPTVSNTEILQGGTTPIFSITADTDPVSLQPGHYWMAIREGLIGSPDDGSDVYWQRSYLQQDYSFKSASNLQNPTTWGADPSTNDLAFQLYSSGVPEPAASCALILPLALGLLRRRKMEN